MPPKRVIPAATIVNNSQTTHQIQQKQIQTRQKEIIENEKMFFSINDQSLAFNMNHMRQLRTYGALNSGLLTGLLGFNGFSGMIVYFVIFFVISFILLCKIKYNAKEYFFNYSDVVYSGLFGDLMVFIVVWVISQNLVHIL